MTKIRLSLTFFLFFFLSGCVTEYVDPVNTEGHVPVRIRYRGEFGWPNVTVFLEPATCSQTGRLLVDPQGEKSIHLKADKPVTLLTGILLPVNGRQLRGCESFVFTFVPKSGRSYTFTHTTTGEACLLTSVEESGPVSKDIQDTLHFRQRRDLRKPGPRDGPYCVDDFAKAFAPAG